MQLQEGRRGLTLGLSLISGQGSHKAGEALIHGIHTDVVVPVTGPQAPPMRVWPLCIQHWPHSQLVTCNMVNCGSALSPRCLVQTCESNSCVLFHVGP